MSNTKSIIVRMVSLAPIIWFVLYDLRPRILIGSANKAVKKLCVAVQRERNQSYELSPFCIAGMIFSLSKINGL